MGDHWSLLTICSMLCWMTHVGDLEPGVPSISQPLLACGLHWLESAGVNHKKLNGLSRHSTEYQLTPAVQAILHIIGDILVWGETWACVVPATDQFVPWRLCG